MNQLITLRQAVQSAAAAAVVLGVGPSVAAAGSTPSKSVQTLSVNAKPLTGHWAAQRDTLLKQGGR